ncbi:MAG TPA: hypothetical protein VE172_14590, partial [Stackebrandtia sp.]|uniref:hypothetical protein n=1 Tax=Stackebrandtia sp. TaxID=2023065 RepID=UPI002D58C2D3
MSEMRTMPGGSARVALWMTVWTAVAFTVFAWATTEVKWIRHGSPWQNDPPDMVVSFTVLAVPVLTAAVVARLWLGGGRRPSPVYRVAQLVRAAWVLVALMGVTVATDGTAAAVRADHTLWNADTKWLVAALGVVAALVATSGVALARATRRLPIEGRGDGDWLDDGVIAARALAGVLPRRAREALGRMVDRLAASIRRRPATWGLGAILAGNV